MRGGKPPVQRHTVQLQSYPIPAPRKRLELVQPTLILGSLASTGQEATTLGRMENDLNSPRFQKVEFSTNNKYANLSIRNSF